MIDSQGYRLLDCGDGRRLDRFGTRCLDRPAPAVARVARGDPSLWSQADARFVRTKGDCGEWVESRPLPARWTIDLEGLVFELKQSGVGHVGLFPEQLVNWRWVAEKVSRITAAGGRMRLLNLFAYTGGTTLAAAAAGAHVVHVDAASNVVAWARRNAELSGLEGAPIRWIAEDARKFVKRQIARGNRYEAIVLDPPSYGHGPRGEVWRLATHLTQLLEACLSLLGEGSFLLLTCHTPRFDAPRLKAMLAGVLRSAGRGGGIHAAPLALRAETGRSLPSGVVVRWTAGDEV